MQFAIKTLDALTVGELHHLYALRCSVFIVEQNCPYQDPDDNDLVAYHVLLTQNAKLVGYARILPPGAAYSSPAIGRVLVEKSHRGSALGRELMKYCIRQTFELFNHQTITISAQLYLLRFYTSLGFMAQGPEYLEDNIPHIKMTLARPA